MRYALLREKKDHLEAKAAYLPSYGGHTATFKKLHQQKLLKEQFSFEDTRPDRMQRSKPSVVANIGPFF